MLNNVIIVWTCCTLSHYWQGMFALLTLSRRVKVSFYCFRSPRTDTWFVIKVWFIGYVLTDSIELHMFYVDLSRVVSEGSNCSWQLIESKHIYYYLTIYLIHASSFQLIICTFNINHGATDRLCGFLYRFRSLFYGSYNSRVRSLYESS